MDGRSTWQVRLYGAFEIINPEGEAICLPTRKAEGLIAALIVNRGSGLSREQLGEILWPAVAPSVRKANLRTALATVRRLVSSDFLDLRGQMCRISDSILVESDQEFPERRSSPRFMPGVQGAWFDRVRGDDPPDWPLIRRVTPTEGFFQTLQWLAHVDPDKVLSFLREGVTLAGGMPASALKEVLSKIPDRGKLNGWKEYFLGRCAVGSNIRAADAYFKTAAFAAQATGDQVLLAYSLDGLLTTAILTNRLADANALCNRLSELSRRKTGTLADGMYHLGRALLLLHAGAENEGFEHLAISQGLCQDSLLSAHIQGLRAFFYATYGQIDAAEALLEHPTKMARESGHTYLAGLCALTHANAEIGKANEEEMSETLKDISFRTANLESIHFRIYIKETIGMGYLRSGNLVQAGQTAHEVRKLRRSVSMAYTPWDEMRLTVKN